METGFSTWAPESTPSWQLLAYWHTEDDQEIFIDKAFPIVKSKIKDQNIYNPQNRILFVTWYELADANTNNWVPLGFQIEDHFGILWTNLAMKKGWDMCE